MSNTASTDTNTTGPGNGDGSTGHGHANLEPLLECFRSCREEIMARTKTRDGYIKLQLLVQAVLMALIEGVTLGGVEAATAKPQVTLLSVPVSLIFWLLYFTDDRLTVQLGSYARRVVSEVQRIGGKSSMLCWDGSSEALGYLKVRLLTRFFIPIIVFCLIPAILLYVYFGQASAIPQFGIIAVLEVAGLVVIFFLICYEFNYRRKLRHEIRRNIQDLTDAIDAAQQSGSQEPHNQALNPSGNGGRRSG